MNYSTIKRIAALTVFVCLSFTSVMFGQENMSSTSTKTFGGRTQFRTWSLGFNAGALAPVAIVGGSKDFQHSDLNLGYGLTLRKQLAHSFGLEGGFLAGTLSGSNHAGAPGNKSYETQLGWSASLMGVMNVATIDFLKRENAVNFIVKTGFGVASYTPELTTDLNNIVTSPKTKDNFIPVGVGAKFKVSNRINFDMGYNMYFINSDQLDATVAAGNDKWSYIYGGLEFSLGNAAKPNLDWVNPLVIMYDELKDPSLRQELEALKTRVATLEAADLLKDSDGDGVADKLDKCPGTEAGIKVDGSGCPMDVDADGVPDSKDSCPTEKGTAEFNGCPGTATTANAIQFEFNSSVLKTSAYPTLDQLSTDLKNGVIAKVQLDGHASEEGTTEYNMSLSKDRANAVKTYLVNSGVSATKIVTKGYGETRPVASNATEEGRQLNRRVEIGRQ
jgi:OOP family OmpA-OmpF porin